MTARVTTLKGPDAGRYYVEELPNYYLHSGEPRGRWLGKGADMLGLRGEVADSEFLAIMAGLDPTRIDTRLGRAYGEGSVRGFDVTASAPKTVSTLFAVGDAGTRRHVLQAHDQAVTSMINWIQDNAHTRFRVGGEIVTVDAEGIIAATFRQHTSRALDPQIHTHVVIANKVRSPDGRWLALDARTLKLDQRTASAHYHLMLRSELTRRLGVKWQAVENAIAEIDHLPDVVIEEFSARTSDIERRLDHKLDRFVDNLEREPTRRERWQLEREAVIDSRPGKPKGMLADVSHERWFQQVEHLGIDSTQMIEDALGRVKHRALDNETALKAIDQALAALAGQQSTWRPAELTREIAAAIPTDIVIDAANVRALLDKLTDYAINKHCVDISRPIPDNVPLRKDGRPVTEPAIDRAITTPEILAQENRLLAWAERRMSHQPTDSADAVNRAARELTGPQAQAAAAIGGDAHLVLVVGPAGTGKTTALTPAVAHLKAEGRPVFGVAPSAAAADVMTKQTGVEADTVDKLLYEHGLRRPPDHRYDLPTGATVIVDEAAMLSTNKLSELAELADTRGWRIALVGDPMQFSAVGRGAMFEYLIDVHGAIELDRVHRFDEQWEAQGSLRLRRGDPTVADLYDTHGRLHGGTSTRMRSEALQAWWKARQNGETVSLAAPTNEAVVELNRRAQQIRIEAGELPVRGRTIDTGLYQLRRGDEIVTRRNHRQLTTSQGLPVRNRDRWTINTLHRNGDLTAVGEPGQIRLPAAYVNQHVELGYAQTSHATQGRTVNRSILYLDNPTNSRGIYVPMTRGRASNDAYVVTDGEHDAIDIIAESISHNWIDRPALARQSELAGSEPSHRPGTLPVAELRSLIDQRETLDTMLRKSSQDIENLTPQYKKLTASRQSTTAKLNQAHQQIAAAHATLDRHDKPFRRRGHEPAIEIAHRVIKELPGQTETLTAEIRAIERRMNSVDIQLTRADKTETKRPALETQLAEIKERLGDDRSIRSRAIRRDTPDRITETIGQRPYGGEPSRTWDLAAGQLDQHQTAYSIDQGLGSTRDLASTAGYHHSRELTASAAKSFDHVTGNGLRMEQNSPVLGI